MLLWGYMMTFDLLGNKKTIKDKNWTKMGKCEVQRRKGGKE